MFESITTLIRNASIMAKLADNNIRISPELMKYIKDRQSAKNEFMKNFRRTR